MTVGTTKKSTATRSLRWFSRKARQVEDGGLRCRGMYFATVETATSIPSFASSFWMRGAPQVTFACDILRIRFTTSRSSPGTPQTYGTGLLRCQKRLNASRCHRITVAGSTMARASFQPAHRFERTIQKVRSHTASRSRRPPRSGSAPRPAGVTPGSRERAPAASETATSSPRGGPRADSTHLPPYPPNATQLKAFLPDGLLGKHRRLPTGG